MVVAQFDQSVLKYNEIQLLLSVAEYYTMDLHLVSQCASCRFVQAKTVWPQNQPVLVRQRLGPGDQGNTCTCVSRWTLLQ